MDDYTRWCDHRLWMMGLEDDCRRFIEAMPKERRERFRSVRVVSWETIYGPDHEDWDDEYRAFVREQAEQPVVYFVVTGRVGSETWFFRVPFTEAMLKDTAPGLPAEMLLRQAEHFFDEQAAGAERF